MYSRSWSTEKGVKMRRAGLNDQIIATNIFILLCFILLVDCFSLVNCITAFPFARTPLLFPVSPSIRICVE